MIHIYTGNGKGKTTSAFGLAMRASGQGLKVCVFQFFKPEKLVCGEEISAKELSIEVVKCEECHPLFMGQVTSDKGQGKVKKAIERMVKEAEKVMFSKKYGMVVLDEVINVIDQGFFSKEKFLKLLKSVPQELELVLTGRGDISGIEEHADYVTAMIDKKHPFRSKVGARKGIEY
ncbi:MAG: cob(I)yrinic acid a,c-diamide adenosyltransferase [Candidatus Gorgyraea atricola]|nr:cob(I)yrinic acid a,c-diamide adenosyltransferase [Candidatus Gorgyraea atricola]